ncbi:hypothetical protein D9611_006602 [Ephemerocybe angulata]|uniref:Galactose oxidase n=1 Tax=Ephemerocybe angulata TaxID=980116 RepID=A0A8H5C7C1_9AGAR|nr:hypothetical protein D9611_006602 [Tulosesus angulatus]
MRSFNLLTLLVSLASGLALGSASSPKSGWVTLPSITLYPRQEHVTLALNSTTLAILGGIIPAMNGDTPTFNTTGILQFYSLHTRQWSLASPAPVPLNHPNGAVVDGKIYLLGGLYDSHDGIWRATPDSWVYTPSKDSWTSLPSLPANDTARGSAAMGVYKDVVYLAGGESVLPLIPGQVQQSVDDVSAFDTRTRKWISLPEKAKKLPGRRDHAGAAVINGVFYVLGGRDMGQENVRGDVFALDLNNLKKGWVVKNGKMPTPRGGIAAGQVKGKIYAFGGEGNPVEGSNGVYDQVEAYDVKRDTWEKLEKMKLPRHGTSATSIGGGIYIPGGGITQSGSPVDAFDVFYP